MTLVSIAVAMLVWANDHPLFTLTAFGVVCTATAKAFEKTHPRAGGVLLGRWLIDSDAVIVDDITTPQPADARSRFAFFRSAGAHHVAIEAAWR
ncbi:MAG: hypothetical protein ABI134_35585, partial [Byssovorax sp.]